MRHTPAELELDRLRVLDLCIALQMINRLLRTNVAFPVCLIYGNIVVVNLVADEQSSRFF